MSVPAVTERKTDDHKKKCSHLPNKTSLMKFPVSSEAAVATFDCSGIKLENLFGVGVGCKVSRIRLGTQAQFSKKVKTWGVHLIIELT